MKTNLIEYIDFDRVNSLLEGFNQSTGFVTAILDLEGNVLSKSGWRTICTHFHRINTETARKCLISDTVLAGAMEEGEKYHYYKCLNGLIDVAVPIIIKGEHIANLFSGQFFFEKPDIEAFKQQGAKYGFREDEYLKALENVPVISEEKVKKILDFLLNMTQLISELTLQRMELLNLNETLRDSEETYRLLYENLNDAVSTSVLNPDGSLGKFIHVNEVACRWLGYTQDEFLEFTPMDLLAENEKGFIDKEINLLLSNKYTVFETRLVTKSGNTIPVELSANTLRLKGRMLLHAIARDISERKRDEILIQEKTTKIEAQNEEYRIINEELEKTKQDALLNYERLQSLFRVTPSGIGLVKDRVIVEINQVICQMLGYTAEELIGQNSKILYPSLEEYLSVGNEKYSQIQKYGTGTVETKWLKKNGELIDIMLSSTPLDMRDLTKGVTFTALDITELKNTIKELERSREDYIKLFEEHAAVKLLIDPFTGQIIDSNQAAANYYGWTRDELRQMNIAQINILSKEQVKASMSKAYNNRKMYFEFKHKLADGSLRDIEVFASKISFNGREVLHSIIHDITKRKKAETDLVEAKEKAEESDRLKTAFLQNLSHEIRTPMNAIMGFSELLLQYTGNKAKIKSFTDIIIMRGNDLLNIINDILDISKIESGQLPVNLEETNLDDIFDELSAFYKAYRKRLKKEHIKFSLQFKCKPYRMLLTDQGKLKQIFINLITNAFKFTEEGKIEVGCTPQNDGNLLFHVSDTGIGIPADKYEIIFERFAQLHHGNKKNTGGTGLGLSIVKALVNLLGGTISVDSEPGKGSTFYFTIPYKPVSVSTQKLLNTGLPDDSGFAQKTLLLVEDDPYNAEYIREALVGAGISIHLAETGTDAIEKSISMPIDLVLMDIRLPDISGYEATRQIKVHKPQLKIIAQTAYASQDERFKALDAGCIDYLSKPTKKGTLLSTLKKYLD